MYVAGGSGAGVGPGQYIFALAEFNEHQRGLRSTLLGERHAALLRGLEAGQRGGVFVLESPSSTEGEQRIRTILCTVCVKYPVSVVENGLEM